MSVLDAAWQCVARAVNILPFFLMRITLDGLRGQRQRCPIYWALLWSLDTCALRDYYRQAEVRQRRLSTAFQCCGVVPQARSEAAGRAVNAVAPIKGQHVGSVVFSELVSFRITLAVIPTIFPTMGIRINVNVVLFFAFVLVRALPVPPPLE